MDPMVLYLGEVGQVARVDADADGAVPEVVQGQRHRRKVQQSAPASKTDSPHLRDHPRMKFIGFSGLTPTPPHLPTSPYLNSELI